MNRVDELLLVAAVTVSFLAGYERGWRSGTKHVWDWIAKLIDSHGGAMCFTTKPGPNVRRVRP